MTQDGDVNGRPLPGGGHVPATVDADAIRRLVADAHRIAFEFMRASGGRLSESIKLKHIAGEMEQVIDPLAGAFRRSPERSGPAPM